MACTGGGPYCLGAACGGALTDRLGATGGARFGKPNGSGFGGRCAPSGDLGRFCATLGTGIADCGGVAVGTGAFTAPAGAYLEGEAWGLATLGGPLARGALGGGATGVGADVAGVGPLGVGIPG